MPLEITKDRVKEVLSATRRLTEKELLVGIPEENTGRDDGQPITNAALGYIHNYGAPEANIPARPFMEPGIAAVQSEIEAILKTGALDAIEGRGAPDDGFVAAGFTAMNSIVKRIQEGIPPPLAEATVSARRRRSKGSTYRRLAAAPDDTTPLWDTGQLIHSITYVIRRRT